MAIFSIKELEKLSGIKAHTIRIWEKRYKLIVPQRTPTNIRFYNNEDLKRLLNVTTLVTNGHKISKVSKMTQEQINKHLDELSKHLDISEQGEIYVLKLIKICLSFDQASFDRVSKQVINHYELLTSFKEVFFPLLSKLGELWSKNKSNPTHERFLSSNLKRLIYQRMPALKGKQKSDKKFLLFLPEWERHDLPLILHHFALAERGVEAIYVGQCIPLGDLIETIKIIKPTHVSTAFTLNNYKEEVSEYLTAILNCDDKLKIHITGSHDYKEISQKADKQVWMDYSMFIEGGF